MPALPTTPLLSYGTEGTFQYNVRQNRFVDGNSQRLGKGLNYKRQKWRLAWNGISVEDAETLRLFFEGLGGTGNFDWTPPGQSTLLKWCQIGDISSRPAGFDAVDFSLEVEQDFA